MNGVVDQILWLQVVRKRQVVEGLEMTDEVLEDPICFVERGSRSDRGTGAAAGRGDIVSQRNLWEAPSSIIC